MTTTFLSVTCYNVTMLTSEYYGYVSSERTDYNTLVPVLEKHQKALGGILEEVITDSRYCSEKNCCI